MHVWGSTGPGTRIASVAACWIAASCPWTNYERAYPAPVPIGEYIKRLLARANAFLGRRGWGQAQIYHFGDCRLDTASHKLLRDGVEVPLIPKESALLAFLLKHPGQAGGCVHLFSRQPGKKG